jgi:hypothetical protein
VDYLDLLQWPAMLITLIATWFIGSHASGKRAAAFWGYLVANVLWVVWGYHDNAWALVTLQFCLAALNIRGVYKNEER